MDAYDIYKKILAFWQKLCVMPSGASVKRHYAHTPVYVRRNGVLHKVTDVIIENGKIILDTENEQTTIQPNNKD